MSSVGMLGSTLNGVGTFRGINIYDSNIPGSAISPGVVNPYSVLTIPSYFRAINFLSKNLASFTRSVRLDGKKLDVAHPLDRLLKGRPNNYQNSWQLWATAFFHYKHYGCGFIRIERRGNTPIALHNMLPDYVVPFRYDGEQYYFNGIVNEVVIGADVVYLCGLSYDGLSSYNPVWLLRETFQRAMLIDRYQTRFLTKGSVIRGSVEFPPGLTDEQIEKIMTIISTHFAGADADRDLLLLAGGASLKNGTMTNKDSELPWLGSWTIKQVAQITGVDPYFLMDSTDTKYNGNAELAWDAVCRDVFDGDCQTISADLTAKLLSDADQARGLTVHLDMASKLRGTIGTQTDVVIKRANAGIISRNEAREELGLPPTDDPEDDKLRVLGDTTVNVPRASPMPVKNSRPAPVEQFAAHKFASCQINLPTPVRAAVLSFAQTIPDTDLAEDGREDDPHVTCLYGMHYNAPDRVAAAVAGFGPVSGTLGPISCFSNAECDVVHATVNSPDLHKLRGVVSGAGPHTDTHPTYTPHVTLAYCKPGMGEKYAGRMDLHGNAFTVETLHHSDREGNVTAIPLTTPINSARNNRSEVFAVMKPLLIEAARRVDAKTAKAIAKRSGKPASEVTEWTARFADEQEHYAREQLQPIAEAVQKCAGVKVDVQGLASAYGSEIRQRGGNTLVRLVEVSHEE